MQTKNDGYIFRRKMPLVTMIVPVYNVSRYIHECVDSIIGQTYENLEVLLVDDGSTDGSDKICDAYAAADSRVHVIRKRNGGQGSARNLGVERADGNYYMFLDSDDWLSRETVSELVKIAEAEHLDLLFFDGESFIDDGDHIDDTVSMQEYRRTHCLNQVVDGVTLFMANKENDEYFSQCCMRLYSAEYYWKNGFRFQEGIIHEDEDFCFLTQIYAERCMAIDARFYHRRYRSGSTMTDMSQIRSAYGLSKALSKLCDELPAYENNCRICTAFTIQMKLYLRLVYDRFYACEGKLKAQCAEKVQPELRKVRPYQRFLSFQEKLCVQNLYYAQMYNSVRKFICRIRKKVAKILTKR